MLTSHAKSALFRTYSWPNSCLLSTKSVLNQRCTLPESIWTALFQRCSAPENPFSQSKKEHSTEQRCFRADVVWISAGFLWVRATFLWVTAVPQFSQSDKKCWFRGKTHFWNCIVSEAELIRAEIIWFKITKFGAEKIFYTHTLSFGEKANESWKLT